MLMIEPECGYDFTYFTKDDSTVLITRFVIYTERRVGTGRAIYEHWESTIPEQFKKIELWSESHESTLFWKKMGFVDDYNSNNEDGSCAMSKVINT